MDEHKRREMDKMNDMFGMQYSISVENQPYPVLCTLSPDGCTAHVPDFPKIVITASTLDAALLRETYGSKIKVFGTEIPHSVRAKEISAEGKNIFAHDPGGKVAEGYRNLTKEVLKLEKQREKNRAGIGR